MLQGKLSKSLHNSSVNDIVLNEDVIGYVIDNSLAYKKRSEKYSWEYFPLNLTGAYYSQKWAGYYVSFVSVSFFIGQVLNRIEIK